MVKLINVHEMLVEIPEKIHDKYTYLGAKYLEYDDIQELLLKEVTAPIEPKNIEVIKCKYLIIIMVHLFIKSNIL
jgi:hypothetical protein